MDFMTIGGKMVPLISIIISMALPIFVLSRERRQKHLRHPYLFSIGSFSFCTIAAIGELFVVKKRLLSGDVGGIEDTIDAVLMTCIALLIITAILNLLAMGLSYEQLKEEKSNAR